MGRLEILTYPVCQHLDFEVIAHDPKFDLLWTIFFIVINAGNFFHEYDWVLLAERHEIIHGRNTVGSAPGGVEKAMVGQVSIEITELFLLKITLLISRALSSTSLAIPNLSLLTGWDI